MYKMAKSKTPRSMRPRRGRKSTKPSKSFVKKVQSIIHKDVETKTAFNTQSNVYYNSGITAAADIVSVLPGIANGTADYQRIGDQLRGQTMSLKGALQLVSPTSVLSNCRVAVRMFVVQPKMFGDNYTVYGNPSWLNILLKKGGTTVGFTGILSDLWAPVNTDAVTKYYDKVFYLNSAYNPVNGQSTLGNSVKFFKHTFKLRNKLLKYDSSVSGGIYPTNYAPQVILGYVHMDGTGPDVLTTAVSMSFDSILNYEDA